MAQDTGKGDKAYISREAFIQRFWAAYTYDDAMASDKQRSAGSMLPEGIAGGAADRGRIATGLQ
jgi:hypothetical protein